MSEFDVVGVGLNATDTLMIVPAYPPCGGKVPFEHEMFSPGGQVATAVVACARMLHLDGHDTPAVEHAARLARGLGIPVAVDVDTIYPGFDRVLPYVDYLIASSTFPSKWTGIPDPFAALAELQRRHGMKVSAMTLGESGALAYSEGQYYYSPAYAVNCVDTTGAGDAFHGGFCYAVLQQMPLAEALEFSNAVAALNCLKIGARGGLATLEQTEALRAQAVSGAVSRHIDQAIARRAGLGGR